VECTIDNASIYEMS